MKTDKPVCRSRAVSEAEVGSASQTEKVTRIARELMTKRGYVVVGLPPEEGTTVVRVGSWTANFAGVLLDGHILRVAEQTDRKDWEEQIKQIFDSVEADPNPVEPGQRFYRCRLLPINSALVLPLNSAPDSCETSASACEKAQG